MKSVGETLGDQNVKTDEFDSLKLTKNLKFLKKCARLENIFRRPILS